MPQHESDINPASQRHWLYGFNAGILVVIGIVVLVVLMVLGDRTRGAAQMDWSSNGANSLSGSTKKLIQEIDNKKQDYQILSLYVDPSDEARKNGDPNHQAEKRRQVMDLLSLYGRSSGHIKVEDAGDKPLDDIEKQVREKFKTQLEPYKDAVEEFNPIAKKLSDFLRDEGDRIAASVQRSNGSQDERQAAASLQANLHDLSDGITQIQRQIRSAADQENPHWTDITDNIKSKCDTFNRIISAFGDPNKLAASIKASGMDAPAITSYLTDAAPRYKAMSDQLKAYQDKLGKLESPKIQEVLSGLGRNCVVIMGPDSAKVLNSYDLYDTKQVSPDAKPQTVFKGEEAVSSALLAMERPDKVKVVFVTASPQRLTTGDYSDLTDILTAANFEVLEWSPPQPPQPGTPPPQADPPAQGKGVVWIVFPPDAPNMQMLQMGMGMPNPQGVIDAVKKHIEQGGNVMFIAESGASDPSGMGAMMGSDYPYDSLVKPFGINVEPKYTVVQVAEGQDRSGARVRQYRNYIDINRFEDHEITRPIQSYDTVFYPYRSPTVIDVQKPLPQDVQAQVLIKTPYSADYWGETQLTPDNPKFDRDADYAAPVPLAAVSVKDKGKPGEQRVMAISCKMIGDNRILEALDARVVGDQVIPVPVFPGNAELMRNSVLWLAGYENMIAVSAKANANVRIGDISPASLTWIRLAVLLAAPLLALVLGGMIWFIRHQ